MKSSESLGLELKDNSCVCNLNELHFNVFTLTAGTNVLEQHKCAVIQVASRLNILKGQRL